MDNKSKIRSGLTALFVICAAVSAYAGDVRVRFYSKYEVKDAVITNTVDKTDKCILALKNGAVEAVYSNGRRQRSPYMGLFGGRSGYYTVETSGQSRVIPGRIEVCIMPGEKGIVLVSSMDMEEYVPVVLSSEMDYALYKPELAKAFAITIRTFAAYNNKRHKRYDFCDLTHCEVFKGVPSVKEMWYKPVRETKGMILCGSCAKEAVYFSACCGGITENAGEFSAGKAGSCGLSKPDMLNGQNLCEGHRYFKWVKYIKITDLEAALVGFVDTDTPVILDMKVSARTASGRVKQLDFTYDSKGAVKHALLDVNKYLSVFGKQSGWALFPSKFFEVKKEGDTYMIPGRGHGHGVGLCLQGASTLAGMGMGYEEILKFYFPELSLGRNY